MTVHEYHGMQGLYIANQEYALDPILQKRNMRKGYVIKDPTSRIIGTIDYNPENNLLCGYHADYGIVVRKWSGTAHNASHVKRCVQHIVRFNECTTDVKEVATERMRRREFSY